MHSFFSFLFLVFSFSLWFLLKKKIKNFFSNYFCIFSFFNLYFFKNFTNENDTNLYPINIEYPI